MADADFQVWARQNPDDPSTNMQITSLRLLKEFGTYVKEDLFSDPAKNRELFLWFLNRTKYRGAQGAKMADLLFQSQFTDLHQARELLKNARVFSCFDDLELEAALPWLDGELTAQDYFQSAQKLTHSLPEKDTANAAARIAVNCLMLAMPPEKLPDRLRKAMLKPWKKGEAKGPCIPPDVNSVIIPFRWARIDPSKAPKLRKIENPSLFPVELVLDTESQGQLTIQLPARSALTALYVGPYMTCIKGAICINGDFAACLQDHRIRKYCFSRDRYSFQPLEDPEEIRDYALHTNGRLHLLEGGNARIWDNMIPQNLEGILGVYAQSSVWVVHKEDGSTYSNIRRMSRKDVIAIAQDASDILLMTRDGQIHSLSQKTCSPAEFWNCMTQRFRDLPDEDTAERLVYKDTEILRTKKGAFLCRPLGSKGD